MCIHVSAWKGQPALPALFVQLPVICLAFLDQMGLKITDVYPPSAFLACHDSSATRCDVFKEGIFYCTYNLQRGPAVVAFTQVWCLLLFQLINFLVCQFQHSCLFLIFAAQRGFYQLSWLLLATL